MRWSPLSLEPELWTKFAIEHHVTGKNCGQVVKEFAALNDIDTDALDAIKQPPRAIPIPPTTQHIKESWVKMVLSGEIHLGEACSPQKLTKYLTVNGKVEILEVSIEGRKIPILDIRQRLLKKQEKYMHLFSDERIESMDYDTLHAIVIHNTSR